MKNFLGVKVENETPAKVMWNIGFFLVFYSIGVVLTLVVTDNFQVAGKIPSNQVALISIIVGFIFNHVFRVITNLNFKLSSYGIYSVAFNTALAIISYFIIRQA